jgi:hypothetical protein
MRERARTDLRGGRSAMVVPAATVVQLGIVRIGPGKSRSVELSGLLGSLLAVQKSRCAKSKERLLFTQTVKGLKGMAV